jgi:hypothetical protein
VRRRARYTHSSSRGLRRLRRGLYPWTVLELPWGHYERYAHLFWRIRIPIWIVMCALGWALLGIAGLAPGALAAYLLEGLLSYRKPTGTRPSPVSADQRAAARAEAELMESRWQTEAVPSPAGWQPPPRVRPAWQWTPPAGVRERLDRVPVLVRLWYKTPIVDRFAYSWMWEHGGWDVLPPAAPADLA